jgi:hypothetical protein
MKRIITLVLAIIFTSLSFLADAQQRYTISCKFVDSKGIPIPGVTLKDDTGESSRKLENKTFFKTLSSFFLE